MDVLKSISDPKVAQALKPCRQTVCPEAAQGGLEAELHAGRHLLIGNTVDLLQGQRWRVRRYPGTNKADFVGVQVRDRRVCHKRLDASIMRGCARCKIAAQADAI